MRNDATLDVNQERRAILEEFFKSVWESGSFVQWVNPKTQKLNVKDVANKILKTTDASIFSKWAQPFRDSFNEDYRNWRQTNEELTTSCSEKRKVTVAMETENPGAFLEKFVKSSLVKELGIFDESILMTVLNTYQALSCERILVLIGSLQGKVKELEAQISKKDKKLALQSETIEYMKTINAIEERHYLGSIRNIYCYDKDLLDSEGKS
jgi:hypothetical protein